MSKWLTPEQVAQMTGNSTANAAEVQPAAAAKPMCPQRFMADTQKRHKLISNLHLVITILLALWLAKMVFKGN